jgi:hypothetical protein
MPRDRISGCFDPAGIECLATAYEDACTELHVMVADRALKEKEWSALLSLLRQVDGGVAGAPLREEPPGVASRSTDIRLRFGQHYFTIAVSLNAPSPCRQKMIWMRHHRWSDRCSIGLVKFL